MTNSELSDYPSWHVDEEFGKQSINTSNLIGKKYIEGRPQVSAVSVLLEQGLCSIFADNVDICGLSCCVECIIIMVCPDEPKGENHNGTLKMLDVILFHKIDKAEKRKILQDNYGIQMTQTMEREVSVMCNLIKGVQEKSCAKSMTNGILSSVKSLMETMGLSMEQTMAA